MSSVMSDLAKNLLFRYYGLGDEPNGKKFPPLHESLENVRNDEEKLITEQSSLTTNEENPTEEISQKDNEDLHPCNSMNELYPRSSRVLSDTDDADEINEDSNAFSIDLGPNVMCNLFDDKQSSLAKEQFVNNVKTAFDTLGTEDTTGNDLSLTFVDDVLPDSVSDVSTIVTIKKSRKSLKSSSSLPPISKKEPVCNEIFADYTNTELDTFPDEIFDKFRTLRMLYLENNNLIELPDKLFTSLQHLQWLDVRNNQLTTLPTNIKSHPCLETLLLQGNRIEQLPLELCLVPRLKTVHVTHNPLIVPPKDIVVQGCSAILEFLRTEWNKLHPEQQVKFKEKRIEPKPSTILCYQSPREKKKRPKILRSKSLADMCEKNVSVREKSRSYKPNSRCENKGGNIAKQQHLMWISKMREVFNKQAAILQKRKDESVMKEWRRDKRSFNKAIEKALARNEGDIPFAIDFQNYSSILKPKHKSEKRSELRKKEKLKFMPPTNINKKMCELMVSLNQLQATKPSDKSTPRTEQKLLSAQIEKILEYRDQIQNLQKYNDVLVAPIENRV